ncbi:MAG: M1 family metallopeptidase, partial [Bacteroidota bacterium]|nr:M1 family metallopeptidase [Bacteroidota bacterium]
MSKIANIFIISVLFLSSCFLHRQEDIDSTVKLEPVVVFPKKEEATKQIHANPYRFYRASEPMIHNLIHTRLELSFDIPKELVFGKAFISLKPHFYPTATVVLDAQSFDIHAVNLSDDTRKIGEPLDYSYSNDKLTVELPKAYTKGEALVLYIDYTAKPAEVSSSGSWAIHSERGIYFRNKTSDNPQLWTQGETESNSCWFPTIDAPNQKMTQEILLTVNREFETLSNGKKVNVLLNDDGTKTVHWKQDKPHAPYLAAVVAGRFEILKDYWRDKEIFVLVEPGDEEAAQRTFGKTYKMVEFFSRKFGYDYPWEKYHQVVVRQFVSGAMENTGAVIFSRMFLTQSASERARIQNEITVAHELSHHWFGDLVTCESWANLPLNESFANYSEYLWLEHEYGRYKAEEHLTADQRRYFFEYRYKNKDLIRYDYKNSGAMFDMHSYNKGGSVLHMLRYEVGDDAFFESLNYYLNRHEYQSAEIHDLRLAFEKVTGKDMNYFFNSWFLDKGYLELDIDYDLSSESSIKINAEQVQNFRKAPLYKLNVPVDFYYRDTVVRRTVLMDEQEEEYSFSFDNKPEFVKFDAENSLLCEKNEARTKQDYIFILKNVKKYSDIQEAIEQL